MQSRTSDVHNVMLIMMGMLQAPAADAAAALSLWSKRLALGTER